jgi:hypothetical protein
MSSRARKRKRRPAPPPPSRSELRNAEARANLEPLAPGERPRAVTVAAVVAAALALANIGLAVGGYEVRGKHAALPGVILFTGLLLAMAWGLWRARYWAVLGMQALLALAILVFALALTVASNITAAVVCVAVVGLGGTLFWFLVRAMARIQMPRRN